MRFDTYCTITFQIIGPLTRAGHFTPTKLRHATALHLLKPGVEFATISQWLGHASVTTTMRYARAEMEVKRQALAKCSRRSWGCPRLPMSGSMVVSYNGALDA